MIVETILFMLYLLIITHESFDILNGEITNNLTLVAMWAWKV